ncbi:MAG: formylglycine-generating enzyme family protein [Bacteroidota bacterium]
MAKGRAGLRYFMYLMFVLVFLSNCSDNRVATSPVIASIQDNMVLIEGDRYQPRNVNTLYGPQYLGGPPSEEGVEISSFKISKYETTQEQWFEVMGQYPPTLSNKGVAKAPIEMVSWVEVQAFIDSLNQLTQRKYRLPTSVEWEYAATGGKKSNNFVYSGTNDPAHDAVWHGGSIPFENSQKGIFTMPVGTKQPNELGLYDMSGNVSEWLSDCGTGITPNTTYYLLHNQEEWPVRDSCDFKLIRGGNGGSHVYSCRVVNIAQYPAGEKRPALGFRLAEDQ